MTAEVRAINGGDIALPGNPSESVIECLEDLLARARAGEITGVAGGYTVASGEGWLQTGHSFEAGHAYGHALIGALESVKYRLLREANE